MYDFFVKVKLLFLLKKIDSVSVILVLINYGNCIVLTCLLSELTVGLVVYIGSRICLYVYMISTF